MRRGGSYLHNISIDLVLIVYVFITCSSIKNKQYILYNLMVWNEQTLVPLELLRLAAKATSPEYNSW